MILKCKHKYGLFCQDARWRVFVTWLRQLFIMFTIATLNHLGFYMLTVSSFISFTVFWLHLVPVWQIIQSVHIQSNIVWNRWKSTLKPTCRSARVSLNQGTKKVNAVSFYLSAEILESVAEFVYHFEHAIANVGKYMQIFVLPAV